jgi:hypothetical protein
MTPEHEERTAELRPIHRMLQATAEGIGNHRLSGVEGAEAGASRLEAQFNATLAQLVALGTVPEGHFLSLQGDAAPNEILVAYGQLAAYLEDEGENEAPPSAGQSSSDEPGVGLLPTFAQEAVGTLDEVKGDVDQLRERLHTLTQRFHGSQRPEEKLLCLERKELTGAADELFMLGHTLRQLIREVSAATAIGATM